MLMARTTGAEPTLMRQSEPARLGSGTSELGGVPRGSGRGSDVSHQPATGPGKGCQTMKEHRGHRAMKRASLEDPERLDPAMPEASALDHVSVT